MIRWIAGLATVLLLGSGAIAGEMDAEFGPKAAPAPKTLASIAKATELDTEHPAQAQRGGFGGFRGGFGFNRGFGGFGFNRGFGGFGFNRGFGGFGFNRGFGFGYPRFGWGGFYPGFGFGLGLGFGTGFGWGGYGGWGGYSPVIYSSPFGGFYRSSCWCW